MGAHLYGAGEGERRCSLADRADDSRISKGPPLLHGDEVVRSREIQEVEVESVAYIVCDALALDTSDYSFAYVARWSEGFVELVKDTGERVIGCAKQILEGMEADVSNDAGMEAKAS